MAKTPTLSIGLPVYNGGRYLEATLDSILAQSFSDFELVACDNASSDDTARILAAFAARDDRVRIARSEQNRGAAWNYNRAVDLARGTYFKWASHDDLLAPRHLELCIGALDADPGLVLAYPRTRLIGPDGETVGDYDDSLDLPQARPSDRLESLLRHMRLCNPVFGVMRRSELLRTSRIGPFVSSDEVLLVELALRGRFAEVPERAFLRRIHPDSCFGGQKTLEQVALWFDPQADLGSFLPRTKKFGHLLRAVHAAPMSERERLASFLVLLRSWLPANWRVIAGEWRRLLVHRFRTREQPVQVCP